MRTHPEVIAHRGASAHAPEHTLAAYDLALELGADTLELDVRQTSDGELVVLHDRTLARTAADPRAVAHVRFADLPADGPLRLADVFEHYGRGTRWLVELKDPRPGVEDLVERELRRAGIGDLTTVQSFDRRVLRRMRRLAPDVAVAPLFWPGLTTTMLLAVLGRTSRYASAVGIFHRAVDMALVQAAHARGMRLRAWTVNEAPEMRRLAALGVDGVITDRPDLAVAVAAVPLTAAA